METVISEQREEFSAVIREALGPKAETVIGKSLDPRRGSSNSLIGEIKVMSINIRYIKIE